MLTPDKSEDTAWFGESMARHGAARNKARLGWARRSVAWRGEV